MNPVIAPQSKEQFARYYQFRWQYLRAPWHQPKGTEVDDLEDVSIHRMIENKHGEIIAVGRLHKIDQYTGQIRYMAVAENQQGQGLGKKIIEALEYQAQLEGVTAIELNAREVARDFYLTLGYQEIKKTHLLFDEIQHFLMTKSLLPLSAHYCDQAEVLTSTWHNTIPVSKAMNMSVSYYDGELMLTNCDLGFNKNLHNTMFAGSIYTLATLTGWGWVYFMLNQAGLAGDIVLADANIKYLKPIAGAGSGNVESKQVIGDLARLNQGRRAKISLQVEVKCGDLVAAIFEGTYVVLPTVKSGNSK